MVVVTHVPLACCSSCCSKCRHSHFASCWSRLPCNSPCSNADLVVAVVVVVVVLVVAAVVGVVGVLRVVPC